MLITVLKGRLLMWVYPLWSAYNVFTSKDVCIHSKGNMTAVSAAGMTVSSKTDLRFPIPGQAGHGSRIIQSDYFHLTIKLPRRVVYVQ